jgi:hypothetical protein
MKQMRHLYLIFLIACFSRNANSQAFVAKLKNGIDCENITINDSIIGNVYKNERFITFKHDFDETYWPIWTKSGNFGSLNKKYFDLLPNEKVFKMATDTSSLFRLACSVHTMDNFNSIGINYCALVKEAVNGNEKSFLLLFTLNDNLDGAAAETHPYIMWQIFNMWSDHKFNLLLLKQSKSNLISMVNFLKSPVFTFPITDVKYYYTTFYPETWNTIKDFIK